uniref:hypothetical protein n=1 Tax=Herpetosiphon llansteffanensis TaxID=2094568 RepID=UPI00196B7041
STTGGEAGLLTKKPRTSVVIGQRRRGSAKNPVKTSQEFVQPSSSSGQGVEPIAARSSHEFALVLNPSSSGQGVEHPLLNNRQRLPPVLNPSSSGQGVELFCVHF